MNDPQARELVEAVKKVDGAIGVVAFGLTVLITFLCWAVKAAGDDIAQAIRDSAPVTAEETK